MMNPSDDLLGVALSERIVALFDGARTSTVEIPAAVIDRTTLHFLDTVGVAVAGSRAAVADTLLGSLRDDDALLVSGGATLLGHRSRASVSRAAFFNGTIAHALDFDDYAMESLIGHPSAAVAPAALAVAEAHGRSGTDTLLAYLIGIETACTLGRIFNPSLFLRGWAATVTLGTFGAAAAAGVLLGLDARQLASAFGVVGSMTGGLKVNVGTMTKPLHAGMAAGNGVLAAGLAARDFTGAPNVFESDEGIKGVLGVESDRSMLSSFAAPFEFADPGIALKRYPSCGATHAAIDAALNVRSTPGFDPSKIHSIRCDVAPHVLNVLVFPRPRTTTEAMFSLDYCICAALVRGKIDLTTFSDAELADPLVNHLMTLVEVVPDSRYADTYIANGAAVATRVTIELDDGTHLLADVPQPSWGPSDPPPAADVSTKFLGCTTPLLGDDQAQAAVDHLLDLWRAASVREVAAALTPAESEQF